jgi:adenosine kinase
VPRLSGEQLRHCIEGAHLLVVNKYEAEIICKKTGLEMFQLRDMVDNLIITLGNHGSEIYEGDQVTHVDIFPTDDIKDPTGVGDGYRAGLLRGVAAGWSLKLSAQVGALCATYVLEQVGTQNHAYTLENFVERFRTRFDDEGALDVLLAENTAI